MYSGRFKRTLFALGTLAYLSDGCGHRAALVDAVLSTRLSIYVTDGVGGAPIGSRVLLFNEAGVPLSIGSIDLFGSRQGDGACLLSRGAVGTLSGIVVAPSGAEIRVGSDRCVPSPAIPFGRYKVWAWHGIDHERWEGTVDLTEGQGLVTLTIPLERAWDARGAWAADLHVHAAASTDSAMPNTQRVLSQVAAGIEVIGFSNHNVSDSAESAIAELGLTRDAAAIRSIELSSLRTHLGVYPAPQGLRVDTEEIEQLEPDALMKFARRISGHPIVQLNHPRFRSTAMFDYFSWDGVQWPPPFPLDFDAIEVINGFTAFDVSGDRRIDESVRDLYTLVDRGHPVAAVGNSDTHDFNWVSDGVVRTLVFDAGSRTIPFPETAFVDAIRSRHTEATTGPYLEVTASPHKGTDGVGPGGIVSAPSGYVWLDVTVSAARFVLVDRLLITVGTENGPRLQKQVALQHPRTFHWSGVVYVGNADTWIGVAADGDTPLPIEQTGTYQRDKWARPGDAPYAVISPILVDRDGDGRWRRGDVLPAPRR